MNKRDFNVVGNEGTDNQELAKGIVEGNGNQTIVPGVKPLTDEEQAFLRYPLRQFKEQTGWDANLLNLCLDGDNV